MYRDCVYLGELEEGEGRMIPQSWERMTGDEMKVAVDQDELDVVPGGGMGRGVMPQQTVNRCRVSRLRRRNQSSGDGKQEPAGVRSHGVGKKRKEQVERPGEDAREMGEANA